MDPVLDPIPPEKILGYSRESKPGPLGWQSEVLTTIPNRRSIILVGTVVSFISNLGINRIKYPQKISIFVEIFRETTFECKKNALAIL